MKGALVIAVVLLGGCGGKKDKDSDKDKGGGTAAGTASTAPPAEKTSAEELFPDGKVGMPAPAAKLVLDMPEAEAKAAAPEVFAYQYGKVPGYRRLEINTHIEDGRLYEVRVELGESTRT